MDKQQAITTLRAIRGSPTTILLYLLIRRQAVTQAEISSDLGYDPKTVRRHCKALLAMGLVEHPTAHQWHLPSGQLFLPGIPAILPPGSTPLITPKQGISPGSDGTTTTTDPPFSPPPNQASSTYEQPKWETEPALAQALTDAGLGRNIWGRLVALPWVTPDYITAMNHKVSNHPDPRKRNTGFLVHCIQSADPAPTICPECNQIDQHSWNCSTSRYQKYAQDTED